MSRRQSIVKALSEALKQIDGTGLYNVNISGNSYPYLKFWDQVSDYPCTYLTAGTEIREYHPGDFTWAFLGVTIKLYTYNENPQDQLEKLLEDAERVIHDNRVIVYDTINGYETTDILVQSITTDEGLLAPYGVGEINLQVRYALPPM